MSDSQSDPKNKPDGASPGAASAVDTPDIQVKDRRFWVRQDWDPSDRSNSRLPTVVEKMKSEIEQGQKRVSEIREAARQMQSETEAVRSRLERDVDRKITTLRAQFIVDMLEVLDNLERFLAVAQSSPQGDAGLRSLVEGITMVRLLFVEKLSRQGVQKIDVLNRPYNPETAEALEIATTNDPNADNQVLAVLQEGYQMNGKTIRPARVKVARLQKQSPSVEPV